MLALSVGIHWGPATMLDGLRPRSTTAEGEHAQASVFGPNCDSLTWNRDHQPRDEMSARALGRPVAARPRVTSVAANAVSGGPFLISTRPPGRIQLGLARLVTGILLVTFLVTVAFRDTQLVRLDAFVPVANAVTGLNDLLTAVLLYAQFSVTRVRALLVLASGFLFKALILVPHALTFPGVFTTNGLLGAQSQSGVWLFPLQQMGFVLCAVAYTILRAREQHAPSGDDPVFLRIAATIATTVGVAVIATWLLIAEGSHLPRLVAADAVHLSEGFRRVIVPLALLMALGSVVVLRRRPTSMIDLWLHVAVWSFLFEALLTTVTPSRFSLIFYVNRGMGMLSSAFVLLVLLSESLMLHRRLVLTTTAREQEREGHRTAMDVMVGSLAHELRQPLAAIQMNGQAGALLLSGRPGDVDEARAAFREIGASVERANDIIDSVRTMFAHSPHDRVALEANDLVREVVDIMRPELEAYRVVLDLDLSPKLPVIRGHRGQLTQVLMNGVKNGVESLVTVSDRERRLRVRTVPLGPDGVAIRIEDSGRGLDPLARDRVFEPFYSTKPRGMGLGLAICRSIIEGHEGTLSLLSGSPHGAVFQVELPARATGDQSRDVPPGVGARGSISPTATPRPTQTSHRV
jgi:signal transduction histidine kinase